MDRILARLATMRVTSLSLPTASSGEIALILQEAGLRSGPSLEALIDRLEWEGSRQS